MDEPKMNLRQALALAIQTTRKAKRLTQEDFCVVSSRTYMSALERGLKSPTVDKLDEISKVMDVHPATVVLLAYTILAGQENAQATIERVVAECKESLADISRSTRIAR